MHYQDRVGKIKVIKIGNTIDQINDNFERVLKIVLELPSGLLGALAEKQQACAIYLSSWTVDDAALARLRIVDGLRIIKLHPHIKIDHCEGGNVMNVHHAIPAEILIRFASKHCKSVTVFHHGSSVTRYISRPNLEFIKV
jgi:hypothetical protein